MADVDHHKAPKKEEQITAEKQKIDLDTILVEEIGQLGPYQLRTLLLVGLLIIFGASNSEYVFTAGRIPTRCYIEGCDVEGQQPEYIPTWILNAVPGTSLTSFDNCQRFANSSVPHPGLDTEEVCPAVLFDQNNLVDCDRFVYENTNTIVYEYDMGCDEWWRTLIGSLRTVGMMFALPISGFISDHWGRRTALVFNAFNTGWIGTLRYFADTYVGFLISQVMEAAFGAAGFSCAYILLMELVGPKYRVAAGATLSTFFAVGHAVLALMAWLVPYWRTLTIILYIPQIFAISYLWLISESLRWYMGKGRYEQSEAVLKKVAQVNGKQLSEKSLQALRNNAEEEKKRKEIEKIEKSKEPWLVVLVFRNRPILIRCLVSPVWWITMTLIYYGLSINSVNLSGNQYVNFFAVSAIEIPGFWTAVLLMDRIGRKPVMIGAFWICGVCQIGYIFMPEEQFAWALTLYLVGKYAIAAVVTVLYVYTAELYPTRYRHRLFAFSSMVGRIGSVTAPLTPALGAMIWEELPFAIFGGFSLLSGALVFITPETVGTFADTMEEAAGIGRKKQQMT